MRVVYDERMTAPAQGFSPSAAKPAAVIQAWREAWPGLQIRVPLPVDVETLSLAHARSYVEDVFAMREPNGFGTCSADVNASLPYTTGAMLTAARWALADGGSVAAPVSGFHHAGWDSGGGFCTFNGLMVTALALQRDHPGLKVGILDYDYHYGNGTDDILEHLRPRDIAHVTAGRKWTQPAHATGFLAHIEDDIARLHDPGIVLYQAGADPHIDDPLGGFLTTSQLAMRDWKVFDGLHRRGVPVAWNLAGGYQTPLSRVIALHVNSFRAAQAVHYPE